MQYGTLWQLNCASNLAEHATSLRLSLTCDFNRARSSRSQASPEKMLDTKHRNATFTWHGTTTSSTIELHTHGAHTHTDSDRAATFCFAAKNQMDETATSAFLASLQQFLFVCLASFKLVFCSLTVSNAALASYVFNLCHLRCKRCACALGLG